MYDLYIKHTSKMYNLGIKQYGYKARQYANMKPQNEINEIEALHA